MRFTELFQLTENEVTATINGVPIRKKDPQQIITVVNNNFNLATKSMEDAIQQGIEMLMTRRISTMGESFLSMLLDQAKAHEIEISPELWEQIGEKVPSLGR